MRYLASTAVLLLVSFLPTFGRAQQTQEHAHSNTISEEGLGRAHMDISCSPALGAQFDRALALLHNFWYARAMERFQDVAHDDPQCAMAYWGQAMTYNHPFWDPPSPADEQAAWTLVQKGMSAKEACAREKLYLAAAAALYRDAGAGTKSARDESYRDAMARVYAQYPDDETALFYGLSILGAYQMPGFSLLRGLGRILILGSDRRFKNQQERAQRAEAGVHGECSFSIVLMCEQ